ncbi:hypothetical protein RB25_09750 [Herbaspirillum rubrisubalbicans]|uniref:Uncharacterized protein n=1 Tax=Herbaspirillum rubrisubalbicans TaxID=80842 RepID=A0ABX9BZV9_9BURK|nr:hypothetical protein RB24_16085 [Herbaspirillum rubrisubalbicans]RAN48616.1 hypothetical protein RB25_09750 [Herbaspirillum rubrisubalbicans]
MSAVTLGDRRHRQGPSYGQARIVEAYSAFCSLSIVGSVQIKQLAVGDKSLEAVRATFWNEYGVIIASREREAVPLQKSGRASTQVDHHVKDGARHAANDLFLGQGRMLEMQPAYATHLLGQGVIDLDDGFALQCRLQVTVAVPARKVAALVTDAVRSDQECVSKR